MNDYGNTKNAWVYAVAALAAIIAVCFWLGSAKAETPSQMDLDGNGCTVYSEFDTWTGNIKNLKVEAREVYEGIRGEAIIRFLEVNTGAPKGATSLEATGFSNGAVMIALFKDGCLMDHATAVMPANAFAAMLRAAGLGEAEKDKS